MVNICPLFLRGRWDFLITGGAVALTATGLVNERDLFLTPHRIDSLWVVQMFPPKNSRWRTVAILKNRRIAISQRQFDQFWQNLALWCVSALQTLLANKILRFLKFKIVEAAIFWKIEKWLYLAIWIDEFRQNLVWWCASILQISSAN